MTANDQRRLKRAETAAAAQRELEKLAPRTDRPDAFERFVDAARRLFAGKPADPPQHAPQAPATKEDAPAGD